MKVALGQWVVQLQWQENAKTCIAQMQEAAKEKADMLVMPEAVLAQDGGLDPHFSVHSAQGLGGPFMTEILRASESMKVVTAFTILVPNGEGKVWNTLVVIHLGKIIAQYNKLHLYDAFHVQESHNVAAGNALAPIVVIGGIRVSFMICYDLRFPELARRLVIDGAQMLVLPAAWRNGPGKQHHWETLVTARAIENTCYMVAVGECGAVNIGCSMAVDPLGNVLVKASKEPSLLFATIEKEKIEHARRLLPVLEQRRFAAPQLLDVYSAFS